MQEIPLRPPSFEARPQPVGRRLRAQFDGWLIGNVDFDDKPAVEPAKRLDRAFEIEIAAPWFRPDVARARVAIVCAVALDCFGDRSPDVLDMDRADATGMAT